MDERHLCHVCDVGMNLYHDDAVYCPISLLTRHSRIASDICTSDVLLPLPQEAVPQLPNNQ